MRLRTLLSASALALAFSLPVHSADAQVVSSAPVDEDGEPIGEPNAQGVTSADDAIVVTGSRIRRPGFDTLEPTVVVSNEYLETRGLTNVADALNEIPGFGVGVTPEGGQSSFGVGQNFVNRFGLGSSRTLTVINGRRHVSTNAPSIFGNPPGVQVDLNVIPARLVERVENIAIGGAPTYGSDAIAGTVNVILRQDFEGVELSALGGLTERGDNERYNLSLIAGHNFADNRGNITAAVTYDYAGGVLGISRDRIRQNITTGTNPLAGSATANIPGRTPATDGRINPDVPFNTGSADGIPNGIYIRNGRIFNTTFGGLVLPATGATVLADGTTRGFGPNGTTRLRFDESGNLVTHNPGIPFGPQNASGGDGFNLAETTQLTSDVERFIGNLLGNYEITDGVRAFFEGSFFRAEGREIVDQSIYNSTLFGGASLPLTFSAADPRLTAQARARLAELGVSTFRLSRASRDLVENNASSTTTVYRGVVGLDGDFQAAGGQFFWEVSANYGRTEGDFFQTVLNQQNFVNAINNCNPTPAFNSAPGGIAPIADPNCAPLDLFGENRASEAARAYVTGETNAKTALEQQVYNANISGNIFDAWGAGPLGVAIGYEHRREYGNFRPDDFQRQGLGRAVPIGGNEGSFRTNEVFGELLIPLVSPANDFFIHSAEIEGKGRYVHNTVNGGFWTYTAGARVSPVSDIQLRGNYTRSLRAPAITELFTPQSPAFNTFPDPCDVVNIAGGPNPAARAQNCAAFFQSYGINGSNFQSTARTATISVLTGGDPNLANEEARSYTFGVVFQPTFIPRFRLAVDWNRIRVTGNIASLTPANVAEGCYDNVDFDAANPDAGNSFCTLFTRVRSNDPALNGQLVNDPNNPGLRTTFVNGAFIEMQGLTAEFQYSFNLAGLGQPDLSIDLGGNLFYLDRLNQSNNGVTTSFFAGQIGNSRLQGQLNFGVTTPSFGVDLQANYQQGALYDNFRTIENFDVLRVGDNWLFNASLSVPVTPDSLFRFTVSNLFDQEPPFPLAGAGFGAYDFLGRRFAASIITRF